MTRPASRFRLVPIFPQAILAAHREGFFNTIDPAETFSGQSSLCCRYFFCCSGGHGQAALGFRMKKT